MNTSNKIFRTVKIMRRLRRTSQLFKTNTNDNVLLVMIGDMPNHSDAVAHWTRFLKTADCSLHIVIHPQKLDMTNAIVSKWHKYVNLMVCDEEHHVNTTWGNGSLAFATLLAIQYALRKMGSVTAFRKIVFLQQDIPLYPYHVIKQQLLLDEKSWFKFRNGDYPDWRWTRPYDFNREDDSKGSAGIDDFNWASAIFALDGTHVSLFFKEPHSYTKDGTFRCLNDPIPNPQGPFERVVAKFPELQSMFDQTDGGHGEWDFGKNDPPIDTVPFEKQPYNPCTNTDEYMFSLRFKAFFPGNEIDDQIRLVQPNVSEYVKRIWIEEDERQLVYAAPSTHRALSLLYGALKFNYSPERVSALISTRIETNSDLKKLQIYMPRMIWWRNMMSTSKHSAYIGIPMCFNPEGLIKFDHKRKCTKSSGTCVLRGKTYESAPSALKCAGDECKQKYQKSSNYDCKTKKHIAQSITYTDWSSFSTLPSNVLRGAILRCTPNGKYKDGIILSSADFRKAISTLSSQEFYARIQEYKKKAHDVHIKESDTKKVIWHPTEYGGCLASEIANAFNLLREVSFIPDNNTTLYRGKATSTVDSNDNDQEDAHAPHAEELLKCACITWQFALEKIRNFSTVTGDTHSYILQPPADKIMIGTFLTNNILSSALASGCLFIRKVLPSSNLQTYSRPLLEQSTYVPTRSVSSHPLKKKFDIEYLFTPRLFSK